MSRMAWIGKVCSHCPDASAGPDVEAPPRIVTDGGHVQATAHHDVEDVMSDNV